MGGGNAQKSAAARKYALVLFCDVFGYNFVQFITRSNVTLANVLTEVMYYRPEEYEGCRKDT